MNAEIEKVFSTDGVSALCSERAGRPIDHYLKDVRELLNKSPLSSALYEAARVFIATETPDVSVEEAQAANNAITAGGLMALHILHIEGEEGLRMDMLKDPPEGGWDDALPVFRDTNLTIMEAADVGYELSATYHPLLEAWGTDHIPDDEYYRRYFCRGFGLIMYHYYEAHQRSLDKIWECLRPEAAEWAEIGRWVNEASSS